MGRKKTLDGLGKEVKTINFDKIVLACIKRRAKQAGTTESNLINHLAKKHLMTDESFYLEMQKYHLEKAQGYQFMKEQVEIKKELR